MLMKQLKDSSESFNYIRPDKVLIRDTKLKAWFTARINRSLKDICEYLCETNQQYKVFHYKGQSYEFFNRSVKDTLGLELVKPHTEIANKLDVYIKCLEDKEKVWDILTILLNHCKSESELEYLLGEEEKYSIPAIRKEVLSTVRIEYNQSLKFIKKMRLLNMIS